MPPAELWNTKVRSYAAFAKQLFQGGIPCCWVLFEDFVRDQARVFETLRNLLWKPAVAVCVVTKSTKEGSKSFRYYRNYYGMRRWLAEIDEASRIRMDESVDWSLAAQFGYRRLSQLAAEPASSRFGERARDLTI